jgi:hypothetical protein
LGHATGSAKFGELAGGEPALWLEKHGLRAVIAFTDAAI